MPSKWQLQPEIKSAKQSLVEAIMAYGRKSRDNPAETWQEWETIHLNIHRLILAAREGEDAEN